MLYALMQQQQEAIKKSNRKWKKTLNIKVTMGKYVIDWVKLVTCRTKFGKTQNGKYPGTKQM